MFILQFAYDYPEIDPIVSTFEGALEEIALSLYEEDAYEWFCVLNEEDSQSIIYDIVKDAYNRALQMSYNYTIEIAKEVKE